MNILVTGGAGYIGSITTIALIAAGHRPVILDNLHNASAAVIERIAEVAGTRPAFVQGDIRDRALLDGLLVRERIDAVIHFAGLKAVGESVAQPLSYFDNNVHGTLVLLAAMQAAGTRTLVFSSSATVYGDAPVLPLREDAPTSATNPYGRSKLMVEQVLADLARSDASWSLTALRYFNPVGGHPGGRLGEDPKGVPNNLMPYIAQVAVGRREYLSIYGDDYPTPDGTGVRDYIHVMDLAEGHLAALDHGHGRAGLHVFNLGTGAGVSVREMLAAFSAACGRTLPHRIAPRRPGDVAACWADPGRAREVLGWQARRDLRAMCEDAWRWQSLNPNGYAA
jgi:UDP-glucose 4-epimerase